MIENCRCQKKFYTFLVKNYPWTWGSYEKFLWKHCNDPYVKNDFFYEKVKGTLSSLCVARCYKMMFLEKKYDVVQMMDFATEERFRQNGGITRVSDYIFDHMDCDFLLGFASSRLYKSVYKSKKAFTVFYKYEINTSDLGVINNFEIVNDLSKICKAFRRNKRSLQVVKTPEYLQYLAQSPCYDKIFYVKHQDLWLQLGILDNTARVLDISEYSTRTMRTAARIAANFGSKVIVDYPRASKSKTFNLLGTYVSAINFKKRKSFPKECFWIPVMDRK